jgi:hypothetical protein
MQTADVIFKTIFAAHANRGCNEKLNILYYLKQFFGVQWHTCHMLCLLAISRQVWQQYHFKTIRNS